MIKFYSAKWSKHCREVEKLLHRSDIQFEKRELADAASLAAAQRDIGIERIPAITGSTGTYYGLANIKQFIEAYGKENGPETQLSSE